ncbi:cytochrome b5-like heme/steroid binding domain-containing protein [Scheffersomyces xylosifermentans]|uniref:cytochrome b5-like heme/steroid binding domain-containing protein n=1 Tax=Scheffersomyces xylosifermentans TaxID=1304137 RepID=UPI00315C8C58
MASMESSDSQTAGQSAPPTEFEIYNDKVDINSLPIFTRSQLTFYNGTERPELYVAIRGYIYDVTNNAKSYGPGKAYYKLVGKDVTRLLGFNKLQMKPADESGNTTTLEDTTWYSDDFTDKQNAIVDKWVIFFRKRYPIVGIVVDHEVSLG